MIAAIEPVFANPEHAAVNAGLIEAIMLAYPDELVTLAAPVEHRAAVMEVFGATRATIGRFDIEVMPPGGIRIARIAAQFRVMRDAVRALRPRALVCLSSTPETFFACRLLSFFDRRVQIVVVLHGNLHNATGWRSRDPRHRMLDSRSSLWVGSHSPIRFVVLETAIREAALALGLLPRGRTDVWPLPINDHEIRPASDRLRSRRVRIAFLGAAKRSKGFGEFLALMRRALQQEPDGYEFSLIGAMRETFTAEETAGLTLTGEMLPRAEFLERLGSVDYICMPLSRDTYALTASGSLLDCIASATPLIATRTAAVAHMAAGGPIGFLADGPEALAGIVLDRARLMDRAMHRTFQRNLVRLQSQRCPGAVAVAVRETLGHGPNLALTPIVEGSGTPEPAR